MICWGTEIIAGGNAFEDLEAARTLLAGGRVAADRDGRDHDARGQGVGGRGRHRRGRGVDRRRGRQRFPPPMEHGVALDHVMEPVAKACYTYTQSWADGQPTATGHETWANLCSHPYTSA